jgi:hypothetical protein
MSRKLIFTFFAISFASAGLFAWVYLNKPLAGIEHKGQADSGLVQYVSLATALVSLLAAIVGLLKDSRKSKAGDT